MKYRGYKVKLSNIYKMERGDKIYSLEISKDGKEIFASDFLYKDEKTAFRDAKSMIRKSTFNTEIIRKNEKKDNIKKDKIYHAKKWNNISNMIILLTNIVTITIFISLLFFVKELSATTDIGALFGILYSVMGLLMVIIMLFWGIFAKGGFKLNEKQRNIYKVVWWMNFFFNNGSFIPYNDQPFENAKKGWYSSISLITLLFETFFAIFVIGMCLVDNNIGYLLYGTIISNILLFINYIFCIIWEITDAKIKNESFPFVRVVTPILTILIMFVFVIFRNAYKC